MLNLNKIILFICLLWPLQSFPSDAACIAVTLTKEAATEGLLGKRAVYDVLRTRMKESGKTACQVIKEPNQFSWVDNSTKFVASKKELTTYKFVSKMKPVVEGAKYFHRKDIKPSWAKRMKPRMKIKDHIFY